MKSKYISLLAIATLVSTSCTSLDAATLLQLKNQESEITRLKTELAELKKNMPLNPNHTEHMNISEEPVTDPSTCEQAGMICTFAGNGISGYNGDNISAKSASFYSPQDIFVRGQEFFK